jgi:hypothetical protein
MPGSTTATPGVRLRGGTGDVDPNETWAFDGRAWTRVTGAGPRRRYAKLVFDTTANAMRLIVRRQSSVAILRSASSIAI